MSIRVIFTGANFNLLPIRDIVYRKKINSVSMDTCYFCSRSSRIVQTKLYKKILYTFFFF